MMRGNLRTALQSAGFRNITDAGSFVRTHDLLAQDAVDLLVASSEVEGQEIGLLVQELRNLRLGSNPFPVVILLLGSAAPDVVKKAIDSGADDILLTPVAPEQLLARIAKLSRQRKPFVVTHDYVGPDRRTKARQFASQSAPGLEAPNPLRVRMSSGIDGTKLALRIAEASATINRLKIERHAVQLEWLVTQVAAAIRDETAPRQSLETFVARMSAAVDDMLVRMRTSVAEAHMGTVGEIRDMVRLLETNLAVVTMPELERLSVATRALARAIGGSAVTVATAG